MRKRLSTWNLAAMAIAAGAFSCSQYHAGETSLTEALLRGDQALVDEYTNAIVFAKAYVDARALDDDRPVSGYVVLRLSTDSYSRQLRPERISEFLFCLLSYQRSEQPSTSERFEECRNPTQCDPCNSGTYPLSDRVREFYREFWKQKLESD